MICVLLILNIFTAFVIEAFLLEYTYSKGSLETALQTKINEMGLAYGSRPIKKKPNKAEEQHEESRCGRVLGMTFTKTGKLVVCDAVYGLYMIDLDKRVEKNRISESRYDHNVEYTALLTPSTLVNGSQNLVFNSLVLAPDDVTVYVSVSSTNFPLQDALWEISSSPSGRILKFNLETHKTEILASGIR